MRLFLNILAGSFLLSGCVEEVDRAAKKRIFSPEDPPAAVASASEKLNAESAETPEMKTRLLHMRADEATERLGAHRLTARLSFEWTDHGQSVRLDETRTLRAASGGVGGDFHATMENSRDQGLEVLRVNGQVFAKSRYGKFRQRLRDRGMAEREREEIFGVMRDIDELFRGQVVLTPSGKATLLGRSTHKYRVALGETQRAATKNAVALPEPVYAKNGVDESTQRRLDFAERLEPVSLQGEVWIDADSGVILKARVDGKAVVPHEKSQSKLSVSIVSDVSEIGKEPILRIPKDFIPDEDKPNGIAQAMERFGFSTRREPDGGVSEEPTDE